MGQIHDLDEPTWKTVEVVPIDIADKEQVAPEVGVKSSHSLIYKLRKSTISTAFIFSKLNM